MGIHFRNPFPTNQLASSRYNKDLANIKKSFNKPAARHPTEPLIRLPKPLANFLKFLGPVTTGTVATALGLAIVGNLATALPTADEDEILRAKRIAQNRGGAPPSDPNLFIGDSAQEIQPSTYSFTGGQSAVLYFVEWELNFKLNGSPTKQIRSFYVHGPIGGFRTINTADNHYTYLVFQVLRRAGTSEEAWIDFDNIATNLYEFISYRILKISRADGEPDTGGNPPPAQAPIITSPGTLTYDLESSKPEVGSSPIPRPLHGPPQQKQPQLPDFPDPIIISPIPFIDPPNQFEQPENPQNNDDTAPKLGEPPKIFEPTILYGPSANPGTTRINFPGGENFTHESRTDRTQEIQIKPPPEIQPPPPPPEKTLTDQVRDVLNQVNTIGIGIVGIGAVVGGIAQNTTADALETAAAAGTCRTTQPGGCSRKMMDDAVSGINKNTNDKLDATDAANALANAEQLKQLGIINNKLGDQLPNGGIGAKLSRFINWSVGDRVIGMMSMIASVHNAFMLSNNVGQTLFSILDNLGNIGSLILKPDGDANINSGEWVTSNLDSLFSTMLGAEVWTSVKASYKAANNIFSTSSNMYDNLRSIHNDSQELLNMVRRDTAELGNALVEEGVISEDNWDIRDPKVKIKSKSLVRLQRMNEGLEALDNKLEAIEQMTSTLLSIAQTASEVKDNVDTLNTQLGDASKAFKSTRDEAIKALPNFDFGIDDLY